jgi:hypothetical protein
MKPSNINTNQEQSFYKALNVHLLKYLGVGLLSGSLVHAATLGGSHAKYLFFIILGVISIVFGHILELRQQKIKIKLSWIIKAIIIAFGTGMLGGSIQHYFDSPQIASFLFAGGFILTFIGLLVQNHIAELSWRKVTFGILIALISYVVLSRLVPPMIPVSFLEGGHSHGNHGYPSKSHHDHADFKLDAENKFNGQKLKSAEPSDDDINRAMNPPDPAPIFASEPENEHQHERDGHDHSDHQH